MRTRPRAYALIEVLVMMSALILLMTLSAQPMRTALSEVPRMDRNYQGWLRTMDLLDTLRQDIENASAMQLSGRAIDGYRLTLETASGAIEYELANEQAVRRTTDDGAQAQTPLEWALPDSRLRLSTWPADSQTAVEVTTWIEHRADGKVQKNFEQTYVFFRKTR